MIEDWYPRPLPEKDSNWDDFPPRCPICGVILRRVSLSEYRCPDHGLVQPRYGDRDADS